MCYRWPMSSFTWSQQTSEYLWIWSQSKVKAGLHSWCCCCLWSTNDCSSCHHLINQVIEMKGLNYHLLCPMQCCIDGALIDEVPNFLVPSPSETTHAIQTVNPFNATHPLIIHWKLNGVTDYFKWENKTRIFSRKNAWWNVPYEIHWTLNSVDKNIVCSTSLNTTARIINKLCDIVCLWWYRCYGQWQLCHCAGKFGHYIIIANSTS